MKALPQHYDNWRGGPQGGAGAFGGPGSGTGGGGMGGGETFYIQVQSRVSADGVLAKVFIYVSFLHNYALRFSI